MIESDARGQESNPTGRSSSIDTEARSNPLCTDAIDADDLLQALSNARRRGVIRVLADGDSDIGTLAEVIAAEEHDTTVDEITSDQRKTVYVVLHQNHLPELVDYGIVDRQRDGTVARRPAYQAARDALASITAIVNGQLDQPLAASLRELVA